MSKICIFYFYSFNWMSSLIGIIFDPNANTAHPTSDTENRGLKSVKT